jgi:osmotically-inducible protein OsmY
MRRPLSKALLASLLLCGVGCGNQDTERLSRIARAAATKLESLGASNEQVNNVIGGLRGQAGDAALDARVSARIRWDRAMEGAHVQVHASGGQVELKGDVRDLVQKRRAVELANDTVGAETVVDQLTMPGTEP